MSHPPRRPPSTTKPIRTTLDPKSDVVFKLLFAAEENRDILVSLLSSVFQPEQEIQGVTVRNPEVRKQEVTDKGVYLDLLVDLDDGTRVDVEMQARGHQSVRSRALYYGTRAYQNQLTRGQDYSELCPVAVVFFTGYTETKSGYLHSEYRLLEVMRHDELTVDLSIHFVELPALRSLTAEELKRNKQLWRWARFFAARTDEELYAVAEEDEMIDQAKRALEQLSEDPHAQELARMREEGRFFRQMELNDARKEGREEGEASRLAKSIIKVLRTRSLVVDESVEARVVGCSVLETLDEWLTRAVTVDDAKDIFSD